MFNKNEVCQKISELNPDLGACDIDTFYVRQKNPGSLYPRKGIMI